MTRLTTLGLSAVTLAACGLVLAVLSGRAELALAIVPFLLGLLRATGVDRRADWSLTHAVSATRVFEGDRLTITVTATAGAVGALPLVELLEPLSGTVRLVGGRNRGLFTLRRDRRVEWRYEIECTRRGRLGLGTVHVRFWDRAGLRARETTVSDAKVVRVYPRALPVRRLPRPRRTQTAVGNYVAPSVGTGLEPGDIRPFLPGDRIRHVNWRASVRFQRLYVTQYHHERNADVVLMLDSLAEAGAAPSTTLDVSIRAAAALASAYLERKDRVGLIDYGGLWRWVRPGSGRAQYERVLDTLLRVDVQFSWVTRDITLVPKRVLPPQALVIAISPMLEPRFEKAILDLAARGFDLVVVSPSPIPLVRRAVRPSATVDLACRLWAVERRAQTDALRRLGLAVVDWDPAEPLDVALDGVARHHRARVAR